MKKSCFILERGRDVKKERKKERRGGRERREERRGEERRGKGLTSVGGAR